MKVEIELNSNTKVIFNDVLKVDMDADNLYIYEGAFVMLYQTIIPFKDIKGYHVERSGRSE